MWKIFKNSGEIVEGPALQRLASALKQVGEVPVLDDQKKDAMRQTVMTMIRLGETGNEDFSARELERLGTRLAQESMVHYLGQYQKKMMWKELLPKIQRGVLSGWRSLFLFRNLRSSVASLIVFTLFLGMFLVAPIDLRLTRASKWTFLESVTGQVFINRNGRIFAASEAFGLQEGDLIFTGNDGFVAIRFLDDSVTRLGKDTSLEISRLYVQPENAVVTQVELSLVSGQVWASVYNLIDGDSNFAIETVNARASVNSRAAFGIATRDEITSLAVFDNVVDMSVKNDGLGGVQSVVAGFQAEVGGDAKTVLASADGIQIQRIEAQNDQWVQTNQVLDQEHQAILKQENEQFIADALTSNLALGGLADFRDNTKALFANADIESARQRFLDVHLGFITAQEYLGKADRYNDYRQKATPLLIQYRVAIEEINENYAQLTSEDEAQAALFMEQMKEEVDLQRKALSLVLPSDPLYTAKQVVNDATVYFARNPSEKAVYLLERARNRLMEVQNLIAKNDLQNAEAAFRSYLSGLDDLVAEVEQAQVSEIETSLFALISEQIKQFKLLTAIEAELQLKNDQRLTFLVTAVKNDSLSKLIDIIVAYRKNGFPMYTLIDFQNTVESFFPESELKAASLAELEKVLEEYPAYLDLKVAQAARIIDGQLDPEVPADSVEGQTGDLADQVIENIEATADQVPCLENCQNQ